MLLPWRDVDLGSGPISTSLTAIEIAKLEELARGSLVLEIGSGYGYSSIAMARAGARHVLAVDPHEGELPGSLEGMRSNLRIYGMEHNVTVMLGTSEDVLPVLLEARSVFDLAFIDGCHKREVVESDLSRAMMLLRHRGILAVHDYCEDTCSGVKLAVDDLFPEGPDTLLDTLFVVRVW